MAEITDLDIVLGAPKKVRLDGKLYTLPAQIPVPLYLKLKAQRDDDTDLLESLHEEVLALFQIHQPEMTVVPCGMGQLFDIIPLVYGPDEEKKALVQTARTGRQSSNGKPAARKRSRSST